MEKRQKIARGMTKKQKQNSSTKLREKSITHTRELHGQATDRTRGKQNARGKT